MPLLDYTIRLLGLSETIHRWHTTIGALEASLSALADIGPPDYSDEGMLQYLRAERILQPYQTRPYKLIELVRIYEAGTEPRRDGAPAPPSGTY